MFLSSLILRVGSAFRGRRIEPSCRRIEFKRRPRDSPCLERLEDRQLLSYTITNLGSLGGTASVPVEVNNHGEVVGFSYTANNAAAHAFLYRHGKMTDLGALGVANSVATGISDRGVVVGMSNTTRGSKQFYAYLEQHGKITNLAPSSRLPHRVERSRSTPEEKSPDFPRTEMMR